MTPKELKMWSELSPLGNSFYWSTADGIYHASPSYKIFLDSNKRIQLAYADILRFFHRLGFNTQKRLCNNVSFGWQSLSTQGGLYEVSLQEN